MEKKKVLTIAVFVCTALLIIFAGAILFHEDKPVYQAQADTHNYVSGGDYSEISFEFGPDVTGKKYSVLLRNAEDEDFMTFTEINVNDKGFQKVLVDEELSGYLVNAHSVIDNEGKAWLIVNMNVMSDDYFYAVYQINNGELRAVTNGAGSIEKTDSEFNMELVTQLAFFGTWYAAQDAKLIGTHVQITSNELRIPKGYGREITSLCDVNAYFLDDDGNYKSGKLKKGTKIELYATDGVSYVLFTDSKGRKGKLKCEQKEYKTYVDGKLDTDAFNGVIYAG